MGAEPPAAWAAWGASGHKYGWPGAPIRDAHDERQAARIPAIAKYGVSRERKKDA
jgi:hypothetical protein